MTRLVNMITAKMGLKGPKRGANSTIVSRKGIRIAPNKTTAYTKGEYG